MFAAERPTDHGKRDLQPPYIPVRLKGPIGGCQNYGPLFGPLNTRCRNILSTEKGTISLTTTHMGPSVGNTKYYPMV